MAQQAAGWYHDPYGRFQKRYWDGDRWTEHVVTGGVQQVDPMGASTVIPFATPRSAYEAPTDPAPLPDDAPEAASETQALLESLSDEERYDESVWAEEPGSDS
ncbi:MAG: DUF2510 domain-containing protein [Ilumatobacteraceae bacterium]